MKGVVVGFCIGFFVMVIIVLITTSCSIPTAQIVPECPTIFLPLVQTGLEQDPEQPCRYIETTVMIRWIYEDRMDGPYRVVDCLQHSGHWEKPVERTDLVEIQQFHVNHLGIAYQGETWLQVLIWHENIRPYTLNLIKQE